MVQRAISVPLSCIAIGLAMSGCSSTPPAASNAPVTASATPAPANAPGSPAGTPNQPNAMPNQAGATPATAPGAPSEHSVYFAFDSSAVASSYEPVIVSNGKYLQNRAKVKVQVQGNADERGSREYNLALGDRRAEAVKHRLELLGLNPGRVEAVSFGKEKPKAMGHDEQAWAENRRADIVATP